MIAYRLKTQAMTLAYWTVHLDTTQWLVTSPKSTRQVVVRVTAIIRRSTRKKRKRTRSWRRSKRRVKRSRKRRRIRSLKLRRRKRKNLKRLHRLMMKVRKRLKACKRNLKSLRVIVLINRRLVQLLVKNLPSHAQFWKSLGQYMPIAFWISTRTFLRSTSTHPIGRKINHLISIWPTPAQSCLKCNQELFCGWIVGRRRARRMTGKTAERLCMTLSCLSGKEIRSSGIRRAMCLTERTLS